MRTNCKSWKDSYSDGATVTQLRIHPHRFTDTYRYIPTRSYLLCVSSDSFVPWFFAKKNCIHCLKLKTMDILSEFILRTLKIILKAQGFFSGPIERNIPRARKKQQCPTWLNNIIRGQYYNHHGLNSAFNWISTVTFFSSQSYYSNSF